MISRGHRLRILQRSSGLTICEGTIDAATGTKIFVIDNLPTISEGDFLGTYVRIDQAALWSQSEGMTELVDAGGNDGAIYKKTAGGSEPSSYTFTNNTTTSNAYVHPRGFVAVLNADFDVDVDPIEAYVSGKNVPLYLTIPAFTVTADNSLACLWLERSDDILDAHVSMPSEWELQISDTVNKRYLYTRSVDSGSYGSSTITIDPGSGYTTTQSVYVWLFVLSPT